MDTPTSTHSFPSAAVPTKGNHKLMEGLYGKGSPASIFPDIKSTMTTGD